MPIPAHLSLAVPDSDLPRIVIVGGGFAGLNLAKSLRKTKAQVVLLDKNNFHTFQPLLYQVATAGLEPDSIAGPLRKSFEGDPNYFFRMVKVTGVDAEHSEVITTIGNLRYDYLVLANGSVTNYFNKKDFRPKVLPLKRIVHALDVRSHILQNFEQAVMTQNEDEFEKLMNIVVVGGGPTGVEVSGALAELKRHILPKDYPDLDFSRMRIHLIEGSERLLNGMSDFAGREALRYIQKMGIEVQLNTFVEDYDGDTVTLNSGTIETATVVWSAGVRGNVVEGLDESAVERSRILVDQYSRVKGTENVFALGDVAMMQSDEFPNGHPMVAAVAMQQGWHLAKNFKNILKGESLQEFKYFNKGSMATIGKNKAVVDMPNGMHFKGFFAWLIWMFVHIMYLIGFRNKLITLNNWVWSYFTYDKGTRLIIRTFNRKFLRRPSSVNKI